MGLETKRTVHSTFGRSVLIRKKVENRAGKADWREECSVWAERRGEDSGCTAMKPGYGSMLGKEDGDIRGGGENQRHLSGLRSMHGKKVIEGNGGAQQYT